MEDTNYNELYQELEQLIMESYLAGVSLEEAEKLAGRFLHAQMIISNDLKRVSLDAKMRKSGLKSVKAAVYLSEVGKSDKKPSDVLLSAVVDTTDIVSQEQEALDRAEVEQEHLERYYNVFTQAHVYFRQMSRGVQG